MTVIVFYFILFFLKTFLFPSFPSLFCCRFGACCTLCSGTHAIHIVTVNKHVCGVCVCVCVRLLNIPTPLHPGLLFLFFSMLSFTLFFRSIYFLFFEEKISDFISPHIRKTVSHRGIVTHHVFRTLFHAGQRAFLILSVLFGRKNITTKKCREKSRDTTRDARARSELFIL